ncbi:MAG: helix-turn-helix transcriptional regulator [Roseibium sp.]|uniref:helix-turn-helix transcriptional regulator n=1 Tax=Roseibium sp. TaxID=1936156 RepID=UPI003D9C42E1
MEPWEVPDRPVSLISALSVMQRMAVREGPDIGVRVVTKKSFCDLDILGQVMLGGATPRAALVRLCVAISRHSTHEQFAIVPAPGGIIVRELLILNLDGETRHIVHQYVAALIRMLCRMTDFNDEPFGRIEMTPHPELGFAHLDRSLGTRPVASTSGTLSLFLPDEVLDRPFPRQVRDLGQQKPPDGWTTFRTAKPYSNTARLYISNLIEKGEPSVQRLADASGISLRSVQRRLASEGTNFQELVDDVRRTRALLALRTSSTPISVIADELGYSGMPAFIRAVRRWVSVSPGQLRRQSLDR